MGSAIIIQKADTKPETKPKSDIHPSLDDDNFQGMDMDLQRPFDHDIHIHDIPSLHHDAHWTHDPLLEELEEEYHKNPPTFFQSVVSGSTAAVAETLSLHWTTARRFREQLKQPKSSNWRVLYRSLLPDLVSMIPITIAQVFFDSLLRRAMGSHGLSTRELMLAAAGAGLMASPFSSYAEMLMMFQQKYSFSLVECVSFHYQKMGFLGIFRGLPICAVRDSFYTSAYLGFAPWLNEHCKTKFSSHPILSKHNHWLPFVFAGPTGGLAAGIVTQPLDCIKTHQQSNIGPMSAWQAGKEIFKEDGHKGFFRGMSGRLQRISVGVIVLSYVNDKIQNWMRNKSS